MLVTNVHTRQFSADQLPGLQAVLDTLSRRDDALWPREVWPAMRFDRPLSPGADGGHGPVRYTVEEYQAGRCVVFRFKAPRGFDGTHRFDVLRKGNEVELRHTLAMNTWGPALLTWPLVFHCMHDALLEDCMAKAQAALGDAPHIVEWPLSVRLLRFVLARGRPRPQDLLVKTPARPIQARQ